MKKQVPLPVFADVDWESPSPVSPPRGSGLTSGSTGGLVLESVGGLAFQLVQQWVSLLHRADLALGWGMNLSHGDLCGPACCWGPLEWRGSHVYGDRPRLGLGLQDT